MRFLVQVILQDEEVALDPMYVVDCKTVLHTNSEIEAKAVFDQTAPVSAPLGVREKMFCPIDGTDLTEHDNEFLMSRTGSAVYGGCPSCGMEWERRQDLSVVVFDDTEYIKR